MRKHTEIKEYRDGIPVFVCEVVNGQFVFMCPNCLRNHYHSSYNGHRNPHCDDNKVFPKGYILMGPNNAVGSGDSE